MKRKDVFSDTRMAGAVVRYHTWPTHQQQTVADHCWNIQRIFLELWPHELSPKMVKFIVYHDAAELVTGDLPFPIKFRYPALRPILDEAERDITQKMGVMLPELTEDEKLRFKICEYIEMMEFGMVEVLMGNRYGAPIVEDTRAFIDELTPKLRDNEQVSVWGYVIARMDRFRTQKGNLQ